MTTQLTNQINRLKEKGFKISVAHSRLTQDDFRTLEKTAERLQTKNHKPLDVLNELLGFQPVPTVELRKGKIEMAPRGGKTIVTLEKDGKKTAAEVRCMLTDNFCYRTGASKALNLAMENFAAGVYL